MKWEFDTTKREGRKAAMSAVFQELSDATQYIVLGIAINRLQEEEKRLENCSRFMPQLRKQRRQYNSGQISKKSGSPDSGNYQGIQTGLQSHYTNITSSCLVCV